MSRTAAIGYEINQVNTSGTVDVRLTPSAYFSVRGGYFHDRYTDTGIPQTTNYRYGAAATAELGIPPELQGPRNFENTPRALINDFDTTKRSNVNVDYNHYFTGLGNHSLRAGYGFQHVVNDINWYYPGGYVDLVFGSSFTFGGVTTGTGTYGYYAVNDRRITNKAGSDIQSLYVQDQWMLGDRLTLNLGIRTEDENIPDFRPEADGAAAIKFSMKDKIAPRLGAAYDVFGNGRMKVFGSWGLYYDWTKYELPRGSFGAETWCTFYRGLDTLDFASLNLDNMPGADLWVTPGTCRDRRFQAEVDPDIRPMRQSSTSGGFEYQLGRNGVLTAHYIHNDLLETIEDIGFLTETGDEGYVIGNPGRGLSALQYRVRRHAGRVRDAAPEAPVRRPRARLQQALRGQLVLQRQLHAEPAVWQLLRPRLVGRGHDADDRRQLRHRPAAGGQHRAARRQHQPRLGQRRIAVGFARQRRAAGPARHRSAARREALWRVQLLVRHPGGRVLLRGQRHAGLHLRDLDQQRGPVRRRP